jgi:hypothetical protein
MMSQPNHSSSVAHDGASVRREDPRSGRYYLRSAERRIRAQLAALWDNDDPMTTETADLLLP